jgi:phosphoadenosine phosphosulfate reductase
MARGDGTRGDGDPAATRGVVAAGRAARLAADLDGLDAAAVIARVLGGPLAGRVALVSSFGAEAAVLLHLVATVDRATPVVFVDTGKLFGETLAYRDRLTARLGLTNVRSVAPDPARLAALDPRGVLWAADRDLCCRIRKVEPLAGALAGFEAWISGRKRFQAATRAALPLVEPDGVRLKINPLAAWTPADLADYARRHDLPAHPMVADGYPSIGCMPCTDRVRPGEDGRAGRWRGAEKTECGIHLGLVGGGVVDGMGI